MTCSASCEYVLPEGFSEARVEVVSTAAQSTLVSLLGRGCEYPSRRECVLADVRADLTVQVRFDAQLLPMGIRADRLSAADDLRLRAADADPAGNRFLLVRPDTTWLVDGQATGTAALVKLSASGQVVWAHDLGTRLGASDHWSLATDPMGGVWIAGSCGGYERFGADRVRTEGACVAHLDADGALLHERVYPGGASFIEIAVGSGGEVAVVGRAWETIDLDGHSIVPKSGSVSTQLVARIDPSSGAVSFATRLAGRESTSELEQAVAVGPSGEIVVAGMVRGRDTVETLGYTGAGYDLEGYVVKYGADNGFVTARKLGSSTRDMRLEDMAVGPDGHVYVAGSYNGSLEVGNSRSVEVRGVAHRDFIARFDDGLGYRWHVDGDGALSMKLEVTPRGRLYAVASVHTGLEWGSQMLIPDPRSVSSQTAASLIALDAMDGQMLWASQIGPGVAFLGSSARSLEVMGHYLGTLGLAVLPTVSVSNVFAVTVP
jgi:hypothetical protein